MPYTVKNQVVSCNSQEEYAQLLEWAREQKYTWPGGVEITSSSNYRESVGGYALNFYPNGRVGHSRTSFYRTETEYGPISEFQDFALEHGIGVEPGVIDMEF